MTGRTGIVREISWRDIFPWLILFRTNVVAMRAPLLFVACLGTLAAPLGWRVAESVWLGEGARQNEAFRRVVEDQRAWPARIALSPSPIQGVVARAERMARNPGEDGLGAAYRRLVGPFRLLFQGESLSVTQYLYLATGTLWSLVVWGFIGGAIARVAVVTLGLEQDLGIVNAIAFVWRRLGALTVAPILPLPAMLLFLLPCVLLGWLMRFDLGVLLGGLLWIFVILLGFILALLAIGLVFGWPFMPAVIVTEEGGDQYEAFHRSYSYVFSRPLHYVFYVLLAGVLALAGCLVIDSIADTTLRCAVSTVSAGTGVERWTQISDVSAGGDASGLLWAGGRLMGFVERCLGVVTTAFRYSIFFVSTATIYLLLRQQVDDAEFDEVYLEEEPLDEQQLEEEADEAS